MPVAKPLLVAVAALGMIGALTVPGSAAAKSHVWKPSYSAAPQSRFTAIDAVSARDVFAVGSGTYDGSPPLVEHWNGTAWSTFHEDSIPAESETGIGAIGIAAGSTDDVWLTTASASGGGPPNLVHWDGTSWSNVSADGLPTQWYGQVAVSPNRSWIVGGDGPYIATYHAGPEPRWSVRQLAHYGGFAAIDIAGPNDAWAVGDSRRSYSGPTSRTLIGRWDGRQWRRVPSPGSLDLEGVAVDGKRSVMAIGSKSDIDGSNRALVWNGHRWRAMRLPVKYVTAVTSDPRGGYLISALSKWHRSSQGRAVFYRFAHGNWSKQLGAPRSFPAGTETHSVLVSGLDTVGRTVWAAGFQHWVCTPQCDARSNYAGFVDQR